MSSENIFDKQRQSIYYELKKIGLEEQECHAEADIIIEHITGINRTQQITSNLSHFKSDWLQEITRILNSRRERKPLAYCLGEVEFAGFMFRIVPGVLIPRVDTETLIEAVIARVSCIYEPVIRIADIGVGCGAIAIALLKRLPECTVWACDISELAIHCALGNARLHNVQDRLTLAHGDWKKVLPNDFDVIVSNPPYLPLSAQQDLQPEITFEPKSALFDGSEDGLTFYRQFAEKLPTHFVVGADPIRPPFAAFEIGDKQEAAVLDIFKQSGWQDLSISRDVNDLPRILMASPPTASPPGG